MFYLTFFLVDDSKLRGEAIDLQLNLSPSSHLCSGASEIRRPNEFPQRGFGGGAELSLGDKGEEELLRLLDASPFRDLPGMSSLAGRGSYG